MAKIKATIPNIKPITPQQQHVSIDNIPNTSTAVALGSFCFSKRFMLNVSHFVNIRNNHYDRIKDGKTNHYFMIVPTFINKM